jgi:hypothetical protein
MWQNVFVLKGSGLRVEDILGKVVKALELKPHFIIECSRCHSFMLSRGMKKEIGRLPS